MAEFRVAFRHPDGQADTRWVQAEVNDGMRAVDVEAAGRQAAIEDLPTGSTIVSVTEQA